MIAIAATLMGLAAPSFVTMRSNQKLSAAANDLYGSLLQARNDAMTKNRRVTVEPISGGNWKTGWLIYADMDNNGSYGSGTDKLITQSPPIESDFTFTGLNGATAPTNFSFDSRGFLQGGFGNRVVFHSNETSREKHVIVAATGRARVCDAVTATTCDSGA